MSAENFLSVSVHPWLAVAVVFVLTILLSAVINTAVLYYHLTADKIRRESLAQEKLTIEEHCRSKQSIS